MSLRYDVFCVSLWAGLYLACDFFERKAHWAAQRPGHPVTIARALSNHLGRPTRPALTNERSRHSDDAGNIGLTLDHPTRRDQPIQLDRS